MTNRSIQMTEALHAYLLAHSLREDAVLQALREETASLPERNMQISPEQGQFMQLLLRLMGARRCLEVGTFTGYSALAMAQVLPADGEVVTCDCSEEWTRIASRYWQQAGMQQRIVLKLGTAADSLAALLDEGQGGRFDFAFIDADKAGYAHYYESCLQLVRAGGLIAIDNTLWDGRVVDPATTDTATEAIRAFNAALHADTRVDISMVPIGDGLSLARKR
ncbi:class I SAM-dependent methyltransferase [Algiphilus sp.]|uniref:class I SAM-dependent methyltransferase n=1 Tax=Algiphilus sp. TaxID=1872431 RepID=UPI003B52BD89